MSFTNDEIWRSLLKFHLIFLQKEEITILGAFSPLCTNNCVKHLKLLTNGTVQPAK